MRQSGLTVKPKEWERGNNKQDLVWEEGTVLKSEDKEERGTEVGNKGKILRETAKIKGHWSRMLKSRIWPAKS